MSMLESAFFLIVNTIVLIIVTVSVGPIMDWLSLWLTAQPAGYISAAPVQFVFGTFYAVILLMEVVLIVRLFMTPLRTTDYSTGEDDW